MIPNCIDITEDRIFVSIPRFWSGIPATLAVFPRNTPPRSSPKLQAYPDWSFHEIGRNVSNPSCSGLISVYKTRQDSCGRLWIIDCGIPSFLEDFRRICPPKFLIVDLNTNRVVRTIVLPENVLKPNTITTSFVIDETSGRCDDAFVYITDTDAPDISGGYSGESQATRCGRLQGSKILQSPAGLIVYDAGNDLSWRITHPSMYANPDFSEFKMEGVSVTLTDGIVGIAHSPNLGVVYFQPFTTDRICSVPTDFLKKGPPERFAKMPITIFGRKSSQGLPLLVDPRDDTLYFNPIVDTSIASYNLHNGQQKIVAYDPKLLVSPAEIRWFPTDSEALYVLSSRFQKFQRKTVSPNETNIWLLRIPLTSNFGYGFFNNFYYRK